MVCLSSRERLCRPWQTFWWHTWDMATHLLSAPQRRRACGPQLPTLPNLLLPSHTAWVRGFILYSAVGVEGQHKASATLWRLEEGVLGACLL